MSPFRRFSRRFWPLHAYLMISMILWPVPPARSYWRDSNEDGVKEWVDEAGLAPIWWDADSDSDGLTNAQEALYGSDPYAKDSDRDGLSDLVERDYTPPSAPFDPWSWDTDGDGYSDHDEYYSMIQGSPLVVHYPSLSGPFYDYRDTDGDGLLNYDDSDPTGMDRDGDGLLNWQDPYMDDANNGAGTGYTPPPMDSDFDGIPDESDPFPWGSYWYDGIEYGGSWSDNDGDGIPNPADAYPNGSFTYNGVEYAGLWSDMDWDGIPDPADSFPYSSTTYWFNGLEYPGSWQDSDWDGIPDPADGWPNDRWNGQPYFTYNGSEYPGAWEDRDGDGVLDAADSWPDDPENGADDDNDGLSNYDERTQHFTDPAKVDTDHDWLTDYEELYVFHTNPKAPRSGLASGQTLLDGQLHLGADTDGDDLPDVLEDYYASLGYGLDKNDPADGAGDLDSDGYTNAQAFTFGWSLIANRGTYDQDGDGIDDAVEDFWAALYPGSMDKTVFEDAVADHDQDGLMNYEEVVRHNINGWLLPADPGDPHSLMRTLGYEVVQGTSPNDGQFMRWWWDVSRADYGGVDNGTPVPADAPLLDVEDVDPAPNGLPDGYESWLAVVGPETNTARAILADEDGDGIPNVWEHRHAFDPRDDTDAVSPFGGVTVPPLVMPNANDPVFYTDNGSGPEFVQAWYDSAMAAYEADLPAHNQLLAQIGKMDPDGDQLANLDEYLHGTHPRIADSDHDGFEDGAELQNGSDPLLAASVPPVVLSVVSGGGQSITAGLAVPKLLVVKASQGGIPRVGSPVTFASTDQRLSLNNGATTLTLLADEAGNATIAIAGASGAAVGAASVQVTAPEVAAALSVSFTLTPATGGGGGSGGGGGGGGGGGPGGPVPTPFSTPPPQYHLFTAKRERSVKYSGTETPSHPTNSREIGGSTEWFKQAETTPPPNFSDDGFNGDADLQGDNEDPGDPRDDLGSTGKYSEVPATEGEPGAYSIENTVTASTNVGPFSGTKTTNGMYTAQNAYPNPGPDDLKQKHASTFFTYGEAVTRLGDVAYQRGDASNGWQGNGPLGIKSYQVMSTHTINSSTLTIEYFDEESGEVLEDSAVVRSCSGRVEQAEVRLQTNTPVDAAHPARMTYSLFKRTISSSGETYTHQATIELAISSGQVSDTATVLSGTLPAEVQAQSGLITMTSPAVAEGEMAAWVLLPVEVVSRDKFLAGSFDIPAGWDNLAMEFIGPGGENLGRYGSLLGGGSTKIYDKVTDIMSEADIAAGGQPSNQKVWFVREGAGSRKISYYTCFNSVGQAQIKLYPDGSGNSAGTITHDLVAAQDFADTISYVDAWVKGTSFNWTVPPVPLPLPVLALASQAADDPSASGISPMSIANSLASGAIITADSNVPLAPSAVNLTLGQPLADVSALGTLSLLQILPLDAIQPATPLSLAPGTVYWLANGILHPLTEEQVTALSSQAGSLMLAAPPPPPMQAAADGFAAGAAAAGSSGPIDNLTRAALIPFFNVINQVEGLGNVAVGLFDGVKGGLQDDWAFLELIGTAGLEAGTWAHQQARVEIQKWKTDPLKRASELKRMADKVCEDMVFKPLEQLGQDLSTWEGFKRRSWQTWQAIKGGAQTTWIVTKSAWSGIVDGLTGWADDFCGRMMTGSEKVHWDSAPWVKDQLLSEINGTTRQMCYTFGYTFGYLCEQVAIGALSAGTVKVAQVATKGGVHLAANLARRTAAAVAARAHMLKRMLAEAVKLPDEILTLFQQRLSMAGVGPTGEGMLKVPLEVLQEGAESARFNFKQYFDSVFDSPNLNKFLRQGDAAAQKAANSLLLDRMAQLKTILGDEFTETLQKNFVKVVEDLILVKRPDGTVDEFFEGFFKAMEGNPSLMKHADEASKKVGGELEPLSQGAKARLKQLLRDPIPGEPHPEIGNPWRLDEVEDWTVPRPIPGNFWARGNLIELWKFKKTYKQAGFEHHPNSGGYDYSKAADNLFVQMKSYSNPDGAAAAARDAIDKLLLPSNTPTGSQLRLHIVHKKETSSTALKQAIEDYLRTGLSAEERARFLPTIFEEFVYP